jgi:hypothetical protein
MMGAAFSCWTTATPAVTRRPKEWKPSTEEKWWKMLRETPDALSQTKKQKSKHKKKKSLAQVDAPKAQLTGKTWLRHRLQPAPNATQQERGSKQGEQHAEQGQQRRTTRMHTPVPDVNSTLHGSGATGGRWGRRGGGGARHLACRVGFLTLYFLFLVSFSFCFFSAQNVVDWAAVNAAQQP